MADEVVYRTEQSDNDDDVWDDSALVKAYDTAVSKAKKEIARRSNELSQSEATNQEENLNTKKKRHKYNKNKRRNKNKSYKWNVGDLCRAVYTEDEYLYDAKIISILEDDMCIVRYLGYGNEEEQALDDLLQSSASLDPNCEESACSAVESDMEWTSKSSRRQQMSQDCTDHVKQPQSTSQQTHYPFTMPQTAFPTTGGMMPPPMGPWPAYPGTAAPTIIPPVPPPPPIDEDLIDGDNEALCSMLMSWYMSGYHTGYYQGLKDGRKRMSRSPDTTSHR